MSNNKEARKQKIAYLWAILTLIITFVIGAGVVSYSDQILPLLLAGIAVLFGPICGILYLIEIRKGVLSADDSEEEQEG